MNASFALVMLALLSAGILCAADRISTTVADLPLEVVEEGAISFTIEYEVAPDLGEVPLRVEMKNPRHIVLQQETATVAGKGSREVTFTAPLRREEAEVMFAVWYGQVWTQALAPIIHTERVAIITREDAARMATQEEAGRQWAERHRDELADGPVAGVLVDDLPGFDADLARRAIARLQAEGLPTLTLNAEEVCNAAILTPEHFHVLVLTSSAVYPAEGGRALERFLASGGDIIALGAPAFRDGASMVQGRWMGAEEMREALAAQPPERILWDFETGAPEDWGYNSGPNSEARWEFVEDGAAGTARALHCLVPDYTNWNTLRAPEVQQPFPAGHEMTCLWARGDPDTTHLALEWVEQDGSRWIAVIPLTTEWRYYALTPHEFTYWRDNPSEGRGGTDDRLRPENAARFTVGLAMTHTRMPAGRHEFWVDEIGTAPNPFGAVAPPGPPEVGPIEMVTPTYKFHPVTNAVSLRVSDRQALLPPGELPVPDGLMSAHPRPQGTGYSKERKWRWIPLLEAFNEEGEVCGTPACMVINRVGRFANSIAVSFALPPDAYSDAVLDMVAAVASRMRDGLFLFEGGAEFYAYFQGDEMRLGARTINTSGAGDPECSVKLFVTSEIGTEFERALPVEGGHAQVTWAPGQFAKRDYNVICSLVDGEGRVLDMLTHPVVVWEPSPEPRYMESRDGMFFLDGERWIAHGVNYMPSSEIGIEDGEYFEYWMDRQPYDPVVTERDLRRIKATGMNMVSVFCYYRSLDSRNLLDILERCRRHGLLVNLSLRPGTPLDFRWDEMRALIETYRLAEHDIIFAYDLAWEPNFGPYDRRARWNEAWERWIIERYGSLENAEDDWGMAVPRADGRVTGPSDEQLREEGDHRVMVAAYRRFLDDLLAKAYGRANRLVRSIAPHQMISFRMSMAGDPTGNPAHVMYDFKGLARSVDIMQPEGYGRIGEWERVRPGRFTADYSRAMAPGRPVLWAEFGYSTWNRDAMRPEPGREEWAGGYYDRFYRMAYDSDADGTVCWYYPGGYRYNERSDYGIINPDGTWRPVTHAIHDWAARMTAPRPRPRVDEWLTIDRDATVKGIHGVYEAVRERYWELVEAGRNPGLRSDGHGLDSATAPPVAVGNVPYGPGRNPHKYLNAEFDRLEMLNAEGEWQVLTDGATVRVRTGAPVLVRAVVGNLGEAAWLAREGEGQVILTCGEAFIPIPHDVPSLGTVEIDGFQVMELRADTEMTFEMGAWPEVQFGEKVRVVVEQG